jgi:hypothetical protein
MRASASAAPVLTDRNKSQDVPHRFQIGIHNIAFRPTRKITRNERTRRPAERQPKVTFSSLQPPADAGSWRKTALVPCCKGQQGDIPGLLDGAGKAALMLGADAGQTAGHNLAALGHKPLQQTDIAVRDSVNLFRAELADLLATEELAASARAAGGTTARAAARTTTGAGARTMAGTLARARTRFRTGGGWCACCLNFIRHAVSSLLSWLSAMPFIGVAETLDQATADSP